jgi:hypothetical protein
MLRSDVSWEEQQRLIGDAKVLAKFANLTPDGVESFRSAHPDFFPASWWDYRPTNLSDGKRSSKMQWEIVQLNIRDSWLFEFQMPLLHSVFLLTSVFDPEEMDWDENQPHPAFVTGSYVLNLESYPYHEVIQWLIGQSWRVKTCLHCKKCFIAEHPKRLFCTNEGDTSCFWAHRKAYHQKHWEDHSVSVNEHRRQEYKKAKRKSGRKSVKNKTAR